MSVQINKSIILWQAYLSFYHFILVRHLSWNALYISISPGTHHGAPSTFQSSGAHHGTPCTYQSPGAHHGAPCTFKSPGTHHGVPCTYQSPGAHPVLQKKIESFIHNWLDNWDLKLLVKSEASTLCLSICPITFDSFVIKGKLLILIMKVNSDFD